MGNVNSGEILFVKSVKDGIPNRDPLAESDARRLFDEEDGRISLSDVSIKRDVRDYVAAKYPNGGEDKNNFVFVKEERNEKGLLLGRSSLAKKILNSVSKEEVNNKQKTLTKAAFDIRVFGAVYSVENENFSQTGPVQICWGHSMHPVDTRYVQGTVVIPSKDIKSNEKGEEEGLSQGTIWTMYTLPFAVFIVPGVINANIAQDTGMTQKDLDLLLEGLWYGTLNRQARGRGVQKPLFLLHVEYKDPFFRIGYLEDYVSLLPEDEKWRRGKTPTSVKDITLDITELSKVLENNKDKISRLRLMLQDELNIKGEMPETVEMLW